MKTIEIRREEMQKRVARLTEYREGIVENGHRPGVLSGAVLKGKAKDWSSYTRSREAVADAVARITEGRVASQIIRRGNTRVRVWVDTQESEPVRLVLV